MHIASTQRLTGPSGAAKTGYSLDAGDIKGDSKTALLIGGPGYSSDTGRVYIIYGGVSWNPITGLGMSFPLPFLSLFI
jgi:hypothetical protein